MAQEVQEALIHIAELIGAAVVGGLIVAGFNHILTAQREAKARVGREKDKFAVFIQKQIAELPERGVRDFYDRTKPSIRDEVYCVRHFLKEKQRSRLDRLWKEYAEDVAQHLDPKNEGAMGKLVRDLHKTARTDFESNYERVKRYLEGFKNISA